MFDVALCLFLLIIAFVGNDVDKYFIFNFGIMGMFSLSLLLKRRRSYKSLPLVLILLWSLAISLLHGYRIYEYSKLEAYNNVLIMAEGFLHIFTGILLLHLIVKYAKSVLMILTFAAVACIPLIGALIYSGSCALILSLALASIIYFMLKKKFIIALIFSWTGCWFVYFNYKWILMKWASRPLAWRTMIDTIKEHPFIGIGFSKFLHGQHIIIDYDKFGLCLRQNDYLSLMTYCGVAIGIFVLCFLIGVLSKVKLSLLFIPAVTLMILPFFQHTMFIPYRASLVIVAFGLIIIKTKEASYG